MTRKWIARKGTLVTRTYAELFRNQSATLTFTLVRRRFHFQTLAYISRVNFFDLSVYRFSSFCHDLNGKNCKFLRIDTFYRIIENARDVVSIGFVWFWIRKVGYIFLKIENYGTNNNIFSFSSGKVHAHFTCLVTSIQILRVIIHSSHPNLKHSALTRISQ